MSVCSEKTHAVCLCLGIRTVATTGKERDATGQEEERIDDDLDFEAAKSNIHYAQFMPSSCD